MAGETTQSLVQILKPKFGKLQTLLPDEARLQKRFTFTTSESPGSELWEPLQVRAPHGITAFGSSGAVVAYNQARPSQVEMAKIPPFAYQLNDFISTQLLDRSKGGGDRAFVDAAEYGARELMKQLRRYVEASILHGQSSTGYAVVASSSGQVITLSPDTYGPGWLGFANGMVFDVFATDASTLVQAGLVCTAVNVTTGTMTFTGTNTGVNVAGNIVVPSGFLANGGTWSDMAGLAYQLSTNTGTVFNVSKTYNLYQSNTTTSAGNFNTSLLLDGAAKIQGQGYNGRVVAIMSPKTWKYANQGISANQIYTNADSASRSVSGTDEIVLKQNGMEIELLSHPYAKPNTIMMVAEPYVKRIGAVDATLNKANSSDPVFEMSQASNSYMLAARTDQAVFVERPAACCIITGITYA